MTDAHRPGKRSKGITDAMHRTIRQGKREHYENDIIHNLLAQLNGPAKPNLKITGPRHTPTASPASSHSNKHGSRAVSSPNEFPNLVRMIHTRSSLVQEGKLEPTEKLSNSDYSTQAEEEALRE